MGKLEQKAVMLAALAFAPAACQAPEREAPLAEASFGAGVRTAAELAPVVNGIEKALNTPCSPEAGQQISNLLSSLSGYAEQRAVVSAVGDYRLGEFALSLAEYAPEHYQRICEAIYISKVSGKTADIDFPAFLSPAASPQELNSALYEIENGFLKLSNIFLETFNELSFTLQTEIIKAAATRDLELANKAASLRELAASTPPAGFEYQDLAERAGALAAIGNLRIAYPSVLVTSAPEREWTLPEVQKLRSALAPVKESLLADSLLTVNRASKSKGDKESYADYRRGEQKITIYDTGASFPVQYSVPPPLTRPEWLSFCFYHEFCHHRTPEADYKPFRIPEDAARALGWRTLAEDYKEFTDPVKFEFLSSERELSLNNHKGLLNAIERAQRFSRSENPADLKLISPEGDAVLIRFPAEELNYAVIVQINGDWYTSGDLIALNGQSRFLVKGNFEWFTVDPIGLPGDYDMSRPAECWAEAAAWGYLRPEFLKSLSPEVYELFKAYFKEAD